jgi:AcrR family transcriptional regulator
MITAEAGVNLAAVHYHFGGKDDLIQAVFVRRLGPLHQERLALLEACEAAAGDAPPPLDELLEGFLAPALRLSRDPSRGGAVFMRLLGRVHAEPSEHFKKIYCTQFSGVVSRYTAALQRALPELPPVELYWRLHFLHGVMSHAMCDASKLELLSGGLCNGQDAEAILARMVPFLAGGLRAPVPRLEAHPCCVAEAEGRAEAPARTPPHSAPASSQEVSVP